ncbi:MAG: hypothetical protein J7M19_04620 [Planctomycetes bacterium]|nr:hypothetical protein [Planctomycetota bacterium]
MNEVFNYWRWFFKGSGGKPGFRGLLNRWLFIHAAVGIVLGFLVKVDLTTAANAVLLPLAGIFVGLSFAWAGNAQGLLQSSEIEEMAKRHAGGFVEYVFVYQTAILTILLTLCLWGLAGLRVFESRLFVTESGEARYSAMAVKIGLFTLSSLTLRECWHVVLGAQWMLLARRTIRANQLKRKSGQSNDAEGD